MKLRTMLVAPALAISAALSMGSPATAQVILDGVTLDNTRGKETDIYLVRKAAAKGVAETVSGALTELRFIYDGTLYHCRFGGQLALRQLKLDIVPVMDGIVVDRIELRLPDKSVAVSALCATS